MRKQPRSCPHSRPRSQPGGEVSGTCPSPCPGRQRRVRVMGHGTGSTHLRHRARHRARHPHRAPLPAPLPAPRSQPGCWDGTGGCQPLLPTPGVLGQGVSPPPGMPWEPRVPQALPRAGWRQDPAFPQCCRKSAPAPHSPPRSMGHTPGGCPDAMGSP